VNVLPPDDVRGILSRLKADADRADEALAAGDGVPPLEPAAAAIELGKLGDKLGKLAARLTAGRNSQVSCRP
jgi:hypothetical protein